MNTIKVGNFVQVNNKLTPGILIDMEIEELNYKISEINLNDSGAKLVSCIIYYEEYSKCNGYYGSECFLSDIKYSISEEDYRMLILFGEELLILLKHYWNKCKNLYSWEYFIYLYKYNQIEVMKWIPIKKIISKNLIEFKDGSIWKCYKRKCNKKNKHHIYIPKRILYGIHFRSNV